MDELLTGAPHCFAPPPPLQTLGIASSAKFSSQPCSSCVPAVPRSFDGNFTPITQGPLCTPGGETKRDGALSGTGPVLLEVWATLCLVSGSL